VPRAVLTSLRSPRGEGGKAGAQLWQEEEEGLARNKGSRAVQDEGVHYFYSRERAGGLAERAERGKGEDAMPSMKMRLEELEPQPSRSFTKV